MCARACVCLCLRVRVRVHVRVCLCLCLCMCLCLCLSRRVARHTWAAALRMSVRFTRLYKYRKAQTCCQTYLSAGFFAIFASNSCSNA